MCPVVTRKKKSITREQALDITQFAITNGFKRVVLGGGEPTLMSYFDEIINELSTHNIETWILTNAISLSPSQISYFGKHKNIVVNISIDGVGEVHNFIRGEGTFQKAMENLKRLVQEGANIAVNTVIQKSNYDKLIETYEYFKDYPLLWHGFSFSEPYHQKELVPIELLPISIEQLYKIYERDQKYKKNVSLTPEMIKSFEMSLYYPEFIMHPGENCPIPKSHIGIDEDGWVLPCWHYPSWKKEDYRNINKRPLKEIVQDTRIKDEIEKAISKNGCKGCSTVCYFWNEKFRTKATNPSGKWFWNRKILMWKLKIKNERPGLYKTISTVKNFLLK